MDANNYQEYAARTLLDVPDFRVTNKEVMLAWNALGLAGEAGEQARYPDGYNPARTTYRDVITGLVFEGNTSLRRKAG